MRKNKHNRRQLTLGNLAARMHPKLKIKKKKRDQINHSVVVTNLFSKSFEKRFCGIIIISLIKDFIRGTEV